VRSPLKARLDRARQETALGAKGGYQSLGGDWAGGDATPVAPLGVGGFQQAEQRAQELSYMRRGRVRDAFAVIAIHPPASVSQCKERLETLHASFHRFFFSPLG
jgi:hypothetical protein